MFMVRPMGPGQQGMVPMQVGVVGGRVEWVGRSTVGACWGRAEALGGPRAGPVSCLCQAPSAGRVLACSQAY